MVIIIEGILLL